MMAMTTSSSISVKPPPATRRPCLLSSAQFMLHPFAYPLFDHALVIQIPGAGQALDPRQHPGVHPQRDGDGFGRLAALGYRALHQPQFRPELRPVIRLRLLAVEERHFL